MNGRSKTALTRVAAHWLRFNAVGLAGVLVQLAVLWFLVNVARLHYLPATVLAVESAVLHNFVWHKTWTWSDRRQASVVSTLVRFNLTNGAVSVLGNLLIMWLLAGAAGLTPVAANLAAIGICSLVNFILCDQFVFITRTARPGWPRARARGADAEVVQGDQAAIGERPIHSATRLYRRALNS